MSRETLIQALIGTLEPMPTVLAMWEAGSAAFDRADEYSDLDMGVLVEEEANEEIWSAVDSVFENLGGIIIRHCEPNPVFTGIDKRTFRLREAPRWLQVDLGLIPESADELYNQPERHGEVRVHFDKKDRLVPPSWNVEARRRAMCEALHHQLMKWHINHGWFRKEIARGRWVDVHRNDGPSSDCGSGHVAPSQPMGFWIPICKGRNAFRSCSITHRAMLRT